jgi:Protein of unknown function (DUF3352)
MPNKMPRHKPMSPTLKTKQQHRRRRIAVAGMATLLITGAVIGIGKIWSGNSGKLDTSNGVSLLPQDTLGSISISTDPERWQQLTEFGIPVSRGVLEQQLAKFQTNFLTNYGYDYRRDIQPWIGKQILLGYLNNPGATPNNPYLAPKSSRSCRSPIEMLPNKSSHSTKPRSMPI